MRCQSSRAGCNLRLKAAVTDRTSLKTPASAGAFVHSCFRRLPGVRIFLAAAWLLCAGPAAAQSPQITVGAAGMDSVPQTTVVPVIQPPVRITERTTVYEESEKGMDRTERRAYRAKVYAARLDSLVQSRDYMFFPNSMQEVPGGLIRYIYIDYFYFGMFIDHVEVHLPTERGFSQYVEMLNFDSMTVRNYQASKMQWGWTISFNVEDGDDLYHAVFEVSTVTGETVLTLLTPHLTMRYVGWLWNKKINDKRYYRMD